MDYLTELLLINFIKGGNDFGVICKADMGLHLIPYNTVHF